MAISHHMWGISRKCRKIDNGCKNSQKRKIRQFRTAKTKKNTAGKTFAPKRNDKYPKTISVFWNLANEHILFIFAKEITITEMKAINYEANQFSRVDNWIDHEN